MFKPGQLIYPAKNCQIDLGFWDKNQPKRVDFERQTTLLAKQVVLLLSVQTFKYPHEADEDTLYRLIIFYDNKSWGTIVWFYYPELKEKWKIVETP